MRFRLAEKEWGRELDAALKVDSSHVRLVCPFIKVGALSRLLSTTRPRELQVITRFNLADCAEGVSDLSALRLLLKRGSKVRGVLNLHAKLYVFGTSRAIVTSANLTDAALQRNHELGCIGDEAEFVDRCKQYFDALWYRAGPDLTEERLASWEERLARHLASGAGSHRRGDLTDEGTDAGTPPDERQVGPWVAGASQAFVKFLGEGNNRVPLSFPVLEEIRSSGCHWALGYPTRKRPSGVDAGALMFIGRLTENPNDTRVFGRAIAMQHIRGRDDATSSDIECRPWKKNWPRYVRVHHAEFVNGSMGNGVSLNLLMDELRARSFATTLRHATKGEGNTNPRKAYLQQPAVEISAEGIAWLLDRLEAAFLRHGRVTATQLAALDWPEVPTVWERAER
ncbi:MAG: phospholipase D family protein [Myxococcota bacterium]